jgi:hypothetical protein
VIVFIVLIALSGYLLTKSDVSYKKPFGYLAIGMVVLIMIFGGILTYTNLGQKFEREARKGNESVRAFLPLSESRNNGIAGVVSEKGEDYLIIQTPQGLRRIETKGVEDISDIEKDQFIIAVGEGDKFNFKVIKIKIADKKDMPSINRGIDLKFGDFKEKDIKFLPPELLQFDEVEKTCIKECFDLNNGPDTCFKKCHK